MKDQELIDFIQRHSEKVEYDGENETLILADFETNGLDPAKYNIGSPDIRKGSLYIAKSEFRYTIFVSTDEFHLKIKKDDFDGVVVAFESGFSKYQKYDASSNENGLLFRNAKAYFEFVEFLQNLASFKNSSFLDFYDSANRSFVLFSIKDGEKIILTTPQSGTIDLGDLEFEPQYEEFKACFSKENKHLPSFLKAAILEYIKNISEKDRLRLLCRNLGLCIDKAKVNFEIYLNELSLEKIKGDYELLREKYFQQQSDILAKLTNQTLGLPISFGGAIVVINQIRENSFGTGITLLSFIAYSLFISSYLKLFYQDVGRIKNSVNQDFSKLIENNFFVKFPDQKIGFESAKSWVVERVDALRIRIVAYFYTQWIFSFIVASYTFRLYQWKIISIIFSILCFILGLLVADSVIFKKRVLILNETSRK